MCDCIKWTNEKLAGQSVQIKQAIVVADGKLAERPFLPLEPVPGHKAGRRERLPQSVMFPHCPFCGVKYEDATGGQS